MRDFRKIMIICLAALSLVLAGFLFKKSAGCSLGKEHGCPYGKKHHAKKGFHGGVMTGPSLDNYIPQWDGRSRDFKTPYEKHHVANTLTKNFEDVRKCYISYLETKPKVVDGELFADWNIAPSGSVIDSSIVSSVFAENLNNCVVEQIKTWTFPQPPSGRQVYTSYKFHFKKSE